MKIEKTTTQTGCVIGILGIMKKADGMKLADEILSVARAKPQTLILDCKDLVAMSYDSIPFVVSAIERTRLGKKNVIASNCNSVIARTLRGADFERVATLETV
jgi:anti-anti-sigma regulatory factor